MTVEEFWESTDEGDFRTVTWTNSFGYDGTTSGVVSRGYFVDSPAIRVMSKGRVDYIDYDYVRKVG